MLCCVSLNHTHELVSFNHSLTNKLFSFNRLYADTSGLLRNKIDAVVRHIRRAIEGSTGRKEKREGEEKD